MLRREFRAVLNYERRATAYGRFTRAVTPEAKRETRPKKTLHRIRRVIRDSCLEKKIGSGLGYFRTFKVEKRTSCNSTW